MYNRTVATEEGRVEGLSSRRTWATKKMQNKEQMSKQTPFAFWDAQNVPSCASSWPRTATGPWVCPGYRSPARWRIQASGAEGN